MSGKYHRLYKGKDENGKRILIDEHRYIMEQYLGRKLRKDEVVHHIDGDKSNNNIENLQVLTITEHKRIHLKDTLLTLKSRQKIKEKLKNRPCLWSRKISDEQLIQMLEDYKKGYKFRQIDRKYSLSNGTFGNIIRGKSYKNKKDLINLILN